MPRSVVRTLYLLTIASSCNMKPDAPKLSTMLDRECSGSSWTRPVEIHRSAHYPSIAAVGDDVFVVASNIDDLFNETAARSAGLVVWQRGRGILSQPKGNFVFAKPKAFIDFQDRLHVVWAEPSQGEPHDQYWRMGPLTDLWESMFTQRNGWSDAHKVYSDPSLAWTHTSNDNFVSIGEENFVAVTTPSGYLSLLRYGASGWSVNPTTIKSDGFYLSLASINNTVFMGFAESTNGGRSINNVRVVRSDDQGGTWKNVYSYSEDEVLVVSNMKLRAGANGAVHAVWIQGLVNGRSALRHVWSSDLGDHWSQTTDLPLVGAREFANPDFQIDQKGKVVVIYSEALPNELNLKNVSWDNGWINRVQLFPELKVGNAEVYQLANGKIGLVMYAGVVASSDTSFATLFAEYCW